MATHNILQAKRDLSFDSTRHRNRGAVNGSRFGPLRSVSVPRFNCRELKHEAILVCAWQLIRQMTRFDMQKRRLEDTAISELWHSRRLTREAASIAAVAYQTSVCQIAIPHSLPCGASEGSLTAPPIQVRRSPLHSLRDWSGKF